MITVGAGLPISVPPNRYAIKPAPSPLTGGLGRVYQVFLLVGNNRFSLPIPNYLMITVGAGLPISVPPNRYAIKPAPSPLTDGWGRVYLGCL
jgi:hypothetical protein